MAYALKFDEKPNYSVMKWILKKNLLDKDIVPDFQDYDWIKKIKEGKFKNMKDLKLNYMKIKNNKAQVKLSDRFKELSIVGQLQI